MEEDEKDDGDEEQKGQGKTARTSAKVKNCCDLAR